MADHGSSSRQGCGLGPKLGSINRTAMPSGSVFYSLRPVTRSQRRRMQRASWDWRPAAWACSCIGVGHPPASVTCKATDCATPPSHSHSRPAIGTAGTRARHARRDTLLRYDANRAHGADDVAAIVANSVTVASE